MSQLRKIHHRRDLSTAKGEKVPEWVGADPGDSAASFEDPDDRVDQDLNETGSLSDVMNKDKQQSSPEQSETKEWTVWTEPAPMAEREILRCNKLLMRYQGQLQTCIDYVRHQLWELQTPVRQEIRTWAAQGFSGEKQQDKSQSSPGVRKSISRARERQLKTDQSVMNRGRPHDTATYQPMRWSNLDNFSRMQWILLQPLPDIDKKDLEIDHMIGKDRQAEKQTGGKPRKNGRWAKGDTIKPEWFSYRECLAPEVEDKVCKILRWWRLPATSTKDSQTMSASVPTGTATARETQHRFQEHVGVWIPLNTPLDTSLPIIQVSTDVNGFEYCFTSEQAPHLKEILSYLPTNPTATKQIRFTQGIFGIFILRIVDGSCIEETYLVTASLVDETKVEGKHGAVEPGHVLITAYPGIATGKQNNSEHGKQTNKACSAEEITVEHELFTNLSHHISQAQVEAQPNLSTLATISVNRDPPGKPEMQYIGQKNTDYETLADNGIFEHLEAQKVGHIALEIDEDLLVELSEELEPPEDRERIQEAVRERVKEFGDQATLAADAGKQRVGDEAWIVGLIPDCINVSPESRSRVHIRSVMRLNIEMLQEMTKDLDQDEVEYYSIAAEAAIHTFGIDAIMKPEEYRRAGEPMHLLDRIIRHSMEPLPVGEPVVRPSFWEIELQEAISHIVQKEYQPRPKTGPLAWRRLPTDHFCYYPSNAVLELRPFDRQAIYGLAIDSYDDFDLRALDDNDPPNPKPKLQRLLSTLPPSVEIRPRDQFPGFGMVIGQNVTTSRDGKICEFSIVGQAEPPGPEDPDFYQFLEHISSRTYDDGRYAADDFSGREWALMRHKYADAIHDLERMIQSSNEEDGQDGSQGDPKESRDEEAQQVIADSTRPDSESTKYSPHSSKSPPEQSPSWDQIAASRSPSLDLGFTYGQHPNFPNLDHNHVHSFNLQESFPTVEQSQQGHDYNYDHGDNPDNEPKLESPIECANSERGSSIDKEEQGKDKGKRKGKESMLYQINNVEQKELLKRSQSLPPELLGVTAARTELEKLSQLLRLEGEPLGEGASPEKLPEDSEEYLEEGEIREDDLRGYHSFEERSRENSKDEENIFAGLRLTVKMNLPQTQTQSLIVIAVLQKDPVHTTPQTSVKIIGFGGTWIQLSGEVGKFYSIGKPFSQSARYVELKVPLVDYWGYSDTETTYIREITEPRRFPKLAKYDPEVLPLPGHALCASRCYGVPRIKFCQFMDSEVTKSNISDHRYCVGPEQINEGPQTMDDYAVYHDGARVVGEMMTVKICEEDYPQGSAVAERQIEGDLATLLEDSSIELGPVQHRQELPQVDEAILLDRKLTSIASVFLLNQPVDVEMAEIKKRKREDLEAQWVDTAFGHEFQFYHPLGAGIQQTPLGPHVQELLLQMYDSGVGETAIMSNSLFDLIQITTFPGLKTCTTTS
ncbi:hypothetical protein C8J56DRAFT_879829 [Mycena floridula]|nr:hypothetical protein C8J56DRAFT_879829 [Mycena floridula]